MQMISLIFSTYNQLAKAIQRFWGCFVQFVWSYYTSATNIANEMCHSNVLFRFHWLFSAQVQHICVSSNLKTSIDAIDSFFNYVSLFVMTKATEKPYVVRQHCFLQIFYLYFFNNTMCAKWRLHSCRKRKLVWPIWLKLAALLYTSL